MRFRTATESDVEAIVALVATAYRGAGGAAGWTTEAHLFHGPRTDAADVRATIARARDTLIVAEHDGAVSGCCTVTDLGDGRAYFGMFAVAPERQGGGLGRALLAEAERIAREELGAAEMTMTVIRSRSELLAWYERRGYRRTGEVARLDRRYEVHVRPGIVVELETLTKSLHADQEATERDRTMSSSLD